MPSVQSRCNKQEIAAIIKVILIITDLYVCGTLKRA